MAYDAIISRTDAQSRIPEDVSNDLLKGLEGESAALTLFRQVRMGSAQTRMPVLAALPTAYFVTGDTGLKQTTEVGWTNKFLNVEEIAAIVPIPEAVLDDSGFDVWAEVRPLLEQAIGRVVDAAVFFGVNKPTSWPAAIVPAAVAAGNVVARGTNTAGAAGGLAADLSDTFGLVEADGYDVDMILANRSYRGRLRNARNADGTPYPELAIDNIYGTPATYPMRGLWPTGLSAAEVIVGDRTEAFMGVRQDFTYKILTESVIQDNTGAIIYNLAQQDMVAMRVVFRCAYQIANTINYDNVSGAGQFPFAVLRSPAV